MFRLIGAILKFAFIFAVAGGVVSALLFVFFSLISGMPEDLVRFSAMAAAVALGVLIVAVFLRR